MKSFIVFAIMSLSTQILANGITERMETFTGSYKLVSSSEYSTAKVCNKHLKIKLEKGWLVSSNPQHLPPDLELERMVRFKISTINQGSIKLRCANDFTKPSECERSKRTTFDGRKLKSRDIYNRTPDPLTEPEYYLKDRIYRILKFKGEKLIYKRRVVRKTYFLPLFHKFPRIPKGTKNNTATCTYIRL